MLSLKDSCHLTHLLLPCAGSSPTLKAKVHSCPLILIFFVSVLAFLMFLGAPTPCLSNCCRIN